SDASGGVAWWAHLGGFVFGAILVFVFRQPERRRWYDEEYE
ncbi:MAG TPA: rhomboid family intramembrane serine protease, partial [bacterium]|nr:rhomboid family intramembrane serine protease [bacterium]